MLQVVIGGQLDLYILRFFHLSVLNQDPTVEFKNEEKKRYCMNCSRIIPGFLDIFMGTKCDFLEIILNDRKFS